MKGLLRRLKGAIGNAVVWGISWAAATFAFWGTWILVGWGVLLSDAWPTLVVMAATSGVSGAMTGLLFSLYLGIAHRHSGILDISPGRSAIVGGIVAIAIPLLMNGAWMVATGSVVPLDIILLGLTTPAVLGAATAGGTVFLARRSALEVHAGATRELEAEQEGVGQLLEG